MEVYKEKRHYQRYGHSSPMHLHLMDNQDQYYYAEMKDYSQGGMLLLTNKKLVVGHLVYLEMKNYDDHAPGPEKYKSYFGSVKWSTPSSSSDLDTKGSHKYGVEYNEPAYYD
ncbi:PilZ domain-containing protein [Desulfobacula sp.]|uniref:PilZ domain-containing protein n=1 Tax=Desulfobacula sp. TaxID=2593537 RepID=UPI002637F7DD|nr:PilZ domain-containing protein [Desulfobacula sp.]